MKKPPTPERIRLTITVNADTHEAFQHYADAAGMSIGRAMGDWLGEQLAAVTFAALKFEEIREAPRQIADQLLPAGATEAGTGRPPSGDVRALPPRRVIRGGNSTGRATK